MNKIIIKLTLSLFAIGISNLFYAQEAVDKKVLDWYNGKSGMQTEKAYKLLKKKKSETVIVAIIDSGMDIEHEDLQGKIWTNTDEIPDNGIDDDNNGYIDDVHGWNFLGNASGENANDIRLEKTRIYAELKKKYEDKDVITIASDEEREEYLLYLEVKEAVESDLAEAQANLQYYNVQLPMYIKMVPAQIGEKIGKKDYTKKDLDDWKVKPGTQDAQMKRLGLMILDGSLEKQLEGAVKHFESVVNYHLNVDHNGRTLIGDDPDDFTDTNYGNNDVEGPDALHGTHVGGIVGAIRGNDLGGDGVANNVLLMSLRAVPNGDEFDKDIALAVRYAVDNGASIINMSFGKAYSPHAKEVYEAFKYADEHGVLLVHAAGNDSKNIDEEPNFPTSRYEFQEAKLDHFLTIGASTRAVKYSKKELGKEAYKERIKLGEKNMPLPASFSNYGQSGVDVFAPGFEIYNSVPQSEYQELQGTSMACPMVAGAAAMLKSYFPSMTMKEIKDVLLETATVHTGELHVKPGGNQPGSLKSDMVDFGTLSVTGGTINLEAAVKACIEMEKK